LKKAFETATIPPETKNFENIESETKQETIPEYQKPDTPLEPHNLSLNGIVTMKNDKFALINNQVVREGDSVEGKVIIKISLEEVELDDNGRTIILQTK